MTDEASKTRAIRGRDFEERYLRGRVIDIGCGSDLVVPHAEPFDLNDGDAQEIGSIRERTSYDAVCSSHCLEHMRNVPDALGQWWSLLKPGGYLVVVVPDEDLYEQGGWPSLFNSDHKATFRFKKRDSWSPVSYEIDVLVSQLPGARVIQCERQDIGYDYKKKKSHITGKDRILYKLNWFWSALCRRLGWVGRHLDRAGSEFFIALGAPVDQTQGSALAQIQVIAQKSSMDGGPNRKVDAS